MTEALTQKVKRIEYGDGKSLGDLDLAPGKFVGFDVFDPDAPQPFIITRVGKEGLIRVNTHPTSDPNYQEGGLYLIHSAHGSSEYWKLKTEGGILKLFSPNKVGEFYVPNICTRKIKTYCPDSVYVGEEEIINGFKGMASLDFDKYIPWLQGEFERLRTGR